MWSGRSISFSQETGRIEKNGDIRKGLSGCGGKMHPERGVLSRRFPPEPRARTRSGAAARLCSQVISLLLLQLPPRNILVGITVWGSALVDLHPEAETFQVALERSDALLGCVEDVLTVGIEILFDGLALPLERRNELARASGLSNAPTRTLVLQQQRSGTIPVVRAASFAGGARFRIKCGGKLCTSTGKGVRSRPG